MNAELHPSGRQLAIGTGIAFVVACLILVIVVLPAEYGVDPTGAGRLLGLTQMKQAAGAGLGNVPVMHSHPRKALQGRVEIRLAGREELEYKAHLAHGEPLLYAWSVQGGEVYFEFHGDPTEGEWPEGFFQSYQIGERSAAEQGSFVAPFTGRHGWYWRNLSDDPVTIVLEASGYYTKLARIE